VPWRRGNAERILRSGKALPIAAAILIVAMIFLVFDVEIIFLYPWAAIFAPAAGNRTPDGRQFGAMLLVEMVIFVAILLVAYLYAWGKGVFRWD